jgi:hypothetical protein
MLHTALITLTAVAAFGMSSAMAHHGGGGRGGGGHGGHSGHSGHSGHNSAAAVHSSILKAGIARTTQSRAEFHNRSFPGVVFSHYENARYPCRTRVPNYYGWPSANVCGGYRW